MTNNPSWPLERFPLLSGPGSVTGRFVQNAVGSSIPSGQICHAETMEVALHDPGRVLDEDGFEGHLDEAASSNSSTNALSFLTLSATLRLISVECCKENVIFTQLYFQAIHVLSHCGNSVNLLVEFDVIESVLPSSGQFLVKLAKRGNNLGIVCKSETNCEKGEPVIISHIRTGSVAHRSGSIQAGDRIKAIDNIALDSCTVEESMRLLQRSGNVVKLCVVKGQDQQDSEAQASNNSIVYSIELSRKSQPLGITIASSSGNTSPVVISSIAPGGLAERTGAMHVGDRIIAINGELLEGKKVAQAINLLQQSTDVVSIKLCRTLGTTEMPTGGWRCSLNNHTLSIIQSDSVSSDGSNKLETPIKSVDSAVESLEDSAEGVGANLAKLGGSSEQAWDSGLSSAADTTTTINGHVNECCACSSTANTPTTTSGGKSIQVSSHNSPSESGTRKHEEDWMRILEALETVGEEEMLKKLEDSIMSYGTEQGDQHLRLEVSNSHHYQPLTCKTTMPYYPENRNNNLLPSFQNLNCQLTKSVLPCRSQKDPMTTPIPNRRTNIYQDYATADQVGYQMPHSGRYAQSRGVEGLLLWTLPPPPMPSPKPSVQMLQSPRETKEDDSPIPFITSPTPLENEVPRRDDPGEIFSVSLIKDPRSRSFGFSVSDGDNATENWEYLPYDRVLQVNGLSTQFLNCDLAVPLLATDHVELLLLRKKTSDKPCHHHHSTKVQSPL
uniref:PDZ domain-containing protein n=1 Tax=Ditylenchus dipsaci TaxID=166011 RepID=A0A915EKA9_9BILA